MPVSLYQQHVADWRACTGCTLSERRNRVVLFRGSVPCDVLFVGEAPGESEDVVGTPFVGPAGKFLDGMILEAFGRNTFCEICRREERIEKQYDSDSGVVCDRGHGGSEGRPLRVGFTNLVGCIPRGDDGGKVAEPEDESIHACSGRLIDLVRIASPVLLVQVGKLAETWLTPGYKVSIPLPLRPNAATVKITHPAAILRARVDQREFFRQQCVVTLRNAVAELSGIRFPAPRTSGKTVVSRSQSRMAPAESPEESDPPF